MPQRACATFVPSGAPSLDTTANPVPQPHPHLHPSHSHSPIPTFTLAFTLIPTPTLTTTTTFALAATFAVTRLPPASAPTPSPLPSPSAPPATRASCAERATEYTLLDRNDEARVAHEREVLREARQPRPSRATGELVPPYILHDGWLTEVPSTEPSLS